MPSLTANQYIETHWIPHKIYEHLSWPRHQTRFKNITEKLVGNKDLDVGCATGHSVFHMNNFVQGEWYGCDESTAAIAYAENAFPYFQFFHYENNTLPFEDNAMDCVICSEVLEHVPDDKALVAELLRVASKRVIITTPCVAVDDPGHLRLYTGDMIENLFGDNLISVETFLNAFWLVVAGNE